MNLIIRILAPLALVLAMTVTASAQSDQKDRTELGVLSCVVEGGFGMLLGSSKAMECSFTHVDGSVERYSGRINKLGIDVGVTGESFMKWLVFTPLGNKIGDYALQGTYGGVSAEASLGIGLGANALIGGSNKKIGLQPVSVEAQTGLNLAVGLSSLTLDPIQ